MAKSRDSKPELNFRGEADAGFSSRPSEIELSDTDILDAMRHIPGYLDITTEDFRLIYQLAHRHALGRVFDSMRARDLMLAGIEPLSPETRLDEAARFFVRQGLKTLPVVSADRHVLGVLTETDILRRLGAGSFLDLLLRLIEGEARIADDCHQTPVSAMVTAPAVTLALDAGFSAMVAAFRAHPGRGTPVVDGQGRLAGLLLRKDFLASCHLEGGA